MSSSASVGALPDPLAELAVAAPSSAPGVPPPPSSRTTGTGTPEQTPPASSLRRAKAKAPVHTYVTGEEDFLARVEAAERRDCRVAQGLDPDAQTEGESIAYPITAQLQPAPMIGPQQQQPPQKQTQQPQEPPQQLPPQPQQPQQPPPAPSLPQRPQSSQRQKAPTPQPSQRQNQTPTPRTPSECCAAAPADAYRASACCLRPPASAARLLPPA